MSKPLHGNIGFKESQQNRGQCVVVSPKMWIFFACFLEIYLKNEAFLRRCGWFRHSFGLSVKYSNGCNLTSNEGRGWCVLCVCVYVCVFVKLHIYS